MFTTAIDDLDTRGLLKNLEARCGKIVGNENSVHGIRWSIEIK
jgi:hypothetical protein